MGLFCKAFASSMLLALAAVPARAVTPNDVSLVLAVKDGDDPLAASLLRQGANANADEVSWPDRTVLMLGAEFDRATIVQMLLAHGANVNATDQDGETPLMWALQSPLGREECVALLLAHGANVNTADKSGKTVLMYAVASQSVEVDVGSSGHQQKGARMWVAADPKVVRLLIAKKADLNARDGSGETALMLAASEGRLDLVKLLIEAGAQRDLQDRAGHDALWHARQAGHKEIAQYLAKADGERQLTTKGE